MVKGEAVVGGMKTLGKSVSDCIGHETYTIIKFACMLSSLTTRSSSMSLAVKVTQSCMFSVAEKT